MREPSASEMDTEKLKRIKSQSIDQIPGEIIKAGGRTIRFESHKLINRLTPNDPYMGRTAPLTSKRCILLFIQQI